jgi:hypothetical protein
MNSFSLNPLEAILDVKQTKQMPEIASMACLRSLHFLWTDLHMGFHKWCAKV